MGHIAEELEAIAAHNGGILRPVQVVEFASNPRTALHKRFEWDDTAAAAQYRLVQAREIIRFTVRTIRDDLPPIHAYVSLQEDRGADSYRRITDVLADVNRSQQLLDQALGEAQSWRRRYETLVALEPAFRAIEQVQRTRRALDKTRAESRSSAQPARQGFAQAGKDERSSPKQVRRSLVRHGMAEPVAAN